MEQQRLILSSNLELLQAIFSLVVPAVQLKSKTSVKKRGFPSR